MVSIVLSLGLINLSLKYVQVQCLQKNKDETYAVFNLMGNNNFVKVLTLTNLCFVYFYTTVPKALFTQAQISAEKSSQ